MPHQCTNCGRTFPDGSKEMLSGCPNCGGNKFQFLPADAVEPPPDTSEPETASAPTNSTPSTSPEERPDRVDADTEIIDGANEREDRAQASARRTFVSDNELPPSEAAEPDHPDEQDRPDLNELRRELDQQFESIKILRRGEYELNLMELYDREEYIVAIEEDGRYVIDVPSVRSKD